MSQIFLGQITVFPYTFAPSGWADCAGQLLPVSQFSALFSLLGTQYGGNGTTNFALPDLRGRVPVGQGQLPGGGLYTMGEQAGVTAVTLLQTNMGMHNHTLNATGAAGTATSPQNNLLAFPKTSTGGGHNPTITNGNIYNPSGTTATLAPTSIGAVGSNQPHNNIQPTLTLRYCIALTGNYPSRG
jgi:microcystin-dependent protein